MTDTTASLQRKISSASDLESVVRTMKALAAASIGQFEASLRSLTDYHRTVELGFVACLRDVQPDSLLSGNRSSRDRVVGAIVFGSDQGLVGQFNEVIVNCAVNTLASLPGKPQVWAIGERVHEQLVDAGMPMRGVFSVPNSIRAVAPLVSQIQIATEPAHVNGEFASVYLFHNKPQSRSLYEPVVQQLLPLDDQWRRDVVRVPWPTKKLPQVIGNSETTLSALVHEYLFISLFRACAESLAAEHASRLAAMQRAEKNIDDVLVELRGTFHRLRQNNIDAELFDVISGFEALEGSARGSEN